MTIGEKILNMRKVRGWSQEDLAEQVGVSRQAVSRWEAGSAKPDADKIIVLCDLFGISADYLLRDDYAGEQKPAAAVQAGPARQVNIRRKLLQIYATWSAIALFALKFISSVSPKVYVISKEMDQYGGTVTQYAEGMLGFVMYYNLEWFLALTLIGLAVGAVQIWQGSLMLQKKTMAALEWGRGLLRKG